MPITRDYLEPTTTDDHAETKFVDRVLYGWARWSHRGAVNLKPTSAGQLWRIVTPMLATYEIRMSDDDFVIVDRQVAHLPNRLKIVVHVEYFRAGTAEEKSRSMGLSRIGFRQRLHAAQWALFTNLAPFVDSWRQK